MRSSEPSSYTPTSSLDQTLGSYSRTYPAPFSTSSWTPSSASSAVSAPRSESSAARASLNPLDLGPPGYQATITLFEGTPDERTVFLGPWEVVGSMQRRVLWQCSYQYELLEHFLPSDIPSDIFPHTLHALHRRYTDPSELERFVTFREAHRIRYTDSDGRVVHDQRTEVKYEFTTVESSMRFQGDVRRKDFLDYYDIEVAWSDVHRQKDALAGVLKGFALAQRLKLWSDRYGTFHSLTVFANRADRRYKEFNVQYFDGEARKDEKSLSVKLYVRGKQVDRRFSFRRMRPRIGSAGDDSASGSSQTSPEGETPPPSPLDIKFLGIQFARKPDYRRFLEQWSRAHATDSEFRGIPFPVNYIELPSPQIPPRQGVSPSTPRSLPPVREPEEEEAAAG